MKKQILISNAHLSIPLRRFEKANSYQFALTQRQLVFAPTLTNKLVSRLANRFPQDYEQRWAWIFPAWFIYFELAAVKPSP